MVNQYQKKVLVVALFAGELMMKCGAEIYRVEETIERICHACRIDYVECFATTTGIFLSLDSGKGDESMQTFIKRIKFSDIDLKKISLLNDFSREFTTTDLSVDEGFKKLKDIAAGKIYPFYARMIGAVVVGLSLCPIFGGGLTDSIFAGIIGGIIYSISTLIDKLDFPKFIRTFAGCAICAFLAIIAFTAGLTTALAPVITASMSIYLPGVAITNAARDMLSGDMLSGVARLTEAVLLAVGIAGGVGIVLKFYSFWYVGNQIYVSSIYSTWLLTVCSLFCVLGFCVLFHSPLSTMFYACVAGAAGQMVMRYLISIDQSTSMACFAGACVLAVLAEFGSRAGKDATTIFIIPGIIPLVPGALLYDAMMKLLEGDVTEAASTAVSTLVTALSIAAALVVISSLTRLFVSIARKINDHFKTKNPKQVKNSGEEKTSDSATDITQNISDMEMQNISDSEKRDNSDSKIRDDSDSEI